MDSDKKWSNRSLIGLSVYKNTTHPISYVNTVPSEEDR